MRRRYVSVLLIVLALAATAPGGKALAAAEALISLRDSGAEGWRRQGRAQELLRHRYGFDKVHVLVNATLDEIPARVRAFLERPSDTRAHRLLWISGIAPGDPASPCPSPNSRSLSPAAATLILVPGCFAERIVLAPGSRHFEITSPASGPQPRFARPSTARPGTPVPVAVVTLPSDAPRFVDQADDILLGFLARNGKVSPARLLAALRHGLNADGSDYTPTLDATAGMATRTVLASARTGIATVADPTADWAGHPARARFLAFDVRRVPDAAADAALRLPAATLLRVLRRDRGGRMVFVNAAKRYYGWVVADDLE